MQTRSFRSILFLPAVLLLAAPQILHAEEGMWTFDNPPLKLLKEKYNFIPSQAWLDHLRLSSVRLNDGGSGSFVSPNGLLLTNHHVARGQLQKNSTEEHNYIRDGFYAPTPDQEMKSPDLEVNVLVAMKDVTARVQGAAKDISDPAKALKARDAEIAAIAKKARRPPADCVPTSSRSNNGGEYWLYQYEVYTDVRIVFAPSRRRPSSAATRTTSPIPAMTSTWRSSAFTRRQAAPHRQLPQVERQGRPRRRADIHLRPSGLNRTR